MFEKLLKCQLVQVREWIFIFQKFLLEIIWGQVRVIFCGKIILLWREQLQIKLGYTVQKEKVRFYPFHFISANNIIIESHTFQLLLKRKARVKPSNVHFLAHVSFHLQCHVSQCSIIKHQLLQDFVCVPENLF